MTCDHAIRAIEAMIDREIEDDERIELEAHLAGCESCRRETDERRAFSHRLGRDLDEAFPAQASAAPRIVFRPRRFPWLRAAAVVIVGIAIGYVGSATGFFTPATAEARELANLSALKDAYKTRSQELEVSLEREATALDQRAARTVAGARRDMASLCLMRAAESLAPPQELVLPQEPEQRVRLVMRQLASSQWSDKGNAVRAFRRLAPGDAPHVERQVLNLNCSERDFTELWLQSVQPAAEPAIECRIESEHGSMRITQFRNARLRVESYGTPTPKVSDGMNLLDFRTRHPQLAAQLRLRGVDGNFNVLGVQVKSDAVDSRPAAPLVPAIVYGSPATATGRVMDAFVVQAVMADSAQAGRSVEDAERLGAEALRRTQAVAASTASPVQADPALIRRYLTDYRKIDEAKLALTRERLNDEVAELERRMAELQRRIQALRKAAVALEVPRQP